MIRSMTAFARREATTELAQLSWEIRSVNHRYLDVSLRVPEEMRSAETVFRERIAAKLNRGKIDCTLRCQLAGQQTNLQLDAEYTRQLVATAQAASGLWPEAGAPNVLDLLRWPGVLISQPVDMAPVLEAAVAALDGGLDDLIAAREREGARLRDLILERLDQLQGLVEAVCLRRPEVLRLQRERLETKLADWRDSLEPGRLEQEMVIHAQKLDVEEETDRVVSHIAEVRSTLKQKNPVGRRLDFLMQEFNREANTLSSKSSDAETTKHAVDMKVLIEQMREQVQNIE